MKATNFYTIVVLFIFTSFGDAAVEQTSSVMDGSGNRASAGALVNISAAGQPGGVRVSTGGTVVNYAGFLGTFSLQPTLDTDGDGLADEVDTDNDNDQVSDEDEISGLAYGLRATTDPNLADTDGDGVTDGEEQFADTNPRDITMFLHIIDMTRNPRVLTWLARGGMSYRVYRLDDLMTGPPGTYLDTVVAGGGVPPWYETTAGYLDTGPASPSTAYYIEVTP
jgi:hypothetical protein